MKKKERPGSYWYSTIRSAYNDGMAAPKIPQWVANGIPILTALAIFAISFGIIAYGRGYRFDISRKTLSPTGLITATSDPTGATVFIDGKKMTATSANINVQPGWYTVSIVKEGYQPWEKRLRVQGEVVARADATLFYTNPSLNALTSGGVTRPVVSPDGTKLAFVILPHETATNAAALAPKTGIWVLDLADKPLGLNRDARQVVRGETLNVTNAVLAWSPDSKQLRIAIKESPTFEQVYTADADTTGAIPQFVPDISVLTEDWATQRALKEKEKLAGLTDDLVNVATSSMRIISFSPDETKILYEATASATIPQIIKPAKIGVNPTEEVRTIKPGIVYVYDIKEDRNYVLGDAATLGIAKTIPTPTPTVAPAVPFSIPLVPNSPDTVQWLPTSRHLLFVGRGKLEVTEYDGTMRQTVYAGPFEDGFAVPWTSSSKIVILTNLNAAASALPNLYAINIR